MQTKKKLLGQGGFTHLRERDKILLSFGKKGEKNSVSDGVGYMALKWIRISLDSWMVVLMESGTKTKSYELVSQIACVCVSFFWY